MSMQEIDLDSWPRKHHFEFFREFDEPFFGVIVQIECAPAYHAARTASVSFFSYYLHKILKAANAVENFRYRTDCDRIVIFDRVDASPTLIRADETFGFGYVPYNDSFELFNKDLESEIARVKSTPGLFTRTYPANLLHISALPWLDFTSISHARRYGNDDSCPKISFGKLSPHPNGSMTMPMSVHVHHGLMDGLQVSQFVEIFRNEMALSI